jgi:hypothetical protein
MTIDLIGTAHVLFAEQQVSDNYKKKDLVLCIEESSQYPQYLKIQFGNTKMDLLNGVNAGMKVKVSVQLKGNNKNGNYFNNFDAFKLEVLG